MDKKNPPKLVQNPLLQNVTDIFSLDSMNSPKLIVPVSLTEVCVPGSAATKSPEIESFNGQEPSAPTPPSSNCISNSIVNKNHASGVSAFERSVPLVVPSSIPSSVPSTTSCLATTSASSCFSPISGALFTDESSKQQSPIKFAGPSYFDISAPQFQSTNRPQTLSSVLPPSSSATINTSNNNYRLGSINLKRPTYAPLPGLQSSAAANPLPNLFVSFNPKFVEQQPPQQQRVDQQPQFLAYHQQLPATQKLSQNDIMSSFGNPSSTGPYSPTTTGSVSSLNSSPLLERVSPIMYRAVYHHWFYRNETGKDRFGKEGSEVRKCMWKPFSMADSLALEKSYSLPSLNEETVVATDGGRYDVNIMKRERISVYWEEKKSLVRRCSWFSKGQGELFVPYDEDIAAKLEEEYKISVTTGVWNRQVTVNNEESVIMYDMATMTHLIRSCDVINDPSTVNKPIRRRSRVKRWIRNSYNDPWANLTSQSTVPKSRLVKRGGFDDFDIDDGEPEKIDHLIFLVHGIGQFCDLKFRTIVEVVDDFRSMSLQLTQSHFQESCEMGEVNRLEILPVSWHKALHSEGTGVDNRLKNITLPSIPRMRDFSNDTILDVLFYTSPVYCQIIVNAVASEMNRLFNIFVKRNPTFNGKISLGGHSLGSLIIFDLLSNQPTPSKPSPSSEEDELVEELAEECDRKLRTNSSRRISVVTVGKAGTGQPLVKYPKLNFHAKFFFAFGSPIACFVATRSDEILGEDFKFPTCDGFFNIFHPYDPIAYRIEPLIIPSLSNVKPVQISHHKGRKRMHLELKETVSHVGQKLVETVRNTWNMMYHLAVNKSVDAAESVITQELSQVLESSSEAFRQKPVNPNLVPLEPINETTNLKVGRLNGGRRIDYVLQETPVEYINEYLFALASHLCYWTSRDAMLLVLKEIYGDIGIYTDNQLPQSILPFDITDAENSNIRPPPV